MIPLDREKENKCVLLEQGHSDESDPKHQKECKVKLQELYTTIIM